MTNDVLNSLIDEFDIFEFNDDKFEELKKEADALRINFDKMTADYKISLLDNKKFSFEFKEADISDIFGKIIECEDESGSEATIQLVIKDFTKFREMKEWELSPNICIAAICNGLPVPDGSNMRASGRSSSVSGVISIKNQPTGRYVLLLSFVWCTRPIPRRVKLERLRIYFILVITDGA